MVTKEILQSWMAEDNGYVLYDPLHPGVFTGYVRFTPERAKSALENNTRNRKIKSTQLRELEEQMKSGNWDENIETITFDENNKVSNGQHRLNGCVHTGVTIRNLVTYGISERAQHYMDRGAGRKLKDDFDIDGRANSKNLSTITKAHYLLNVKGFSPKTIMQKGPAISSIPDSILFDYNCEHKSELEAKERLYAKVYNTVRLLKIGEILKILVLAFDSVNSDDANHFWKVLGTGQSTIENDPIILCRERLLAHAIDKHKKLNQETIAALIIKAWNAYERGETIKQLKYTAGGVNKESFPAIYNPYTDE